MIEERDISVAERGGTRHAVDVYRPDAPDRCPVLHASFCETAALGWLVDFASSAYEDYHPRAGKSPEQESQCLTTAADAEVLRSMALSRIREAAETGELGSHARLAYLLYRWRDFAEDSGVEVRR
jgi:hypothetical protein